ncbi:MAG: hypothetical protein HYV09_08405 [Deltaproteobacteria bacterium]|nr:hypothetical protein [Deltaproteobacteria bacterium]
MRLRRDDALPHVRALFTDAKVPHRIVGGLAILHDGYALTTEGIDLLVGRDAWERLSPYLAAHGFERAGAHLRHVATGVRVDLFVEGHRLARPGILA